MHNFVLQVGKSSANFSMLSMNETSEAISSSKVKVAMYKGLTVAVYMVDKTEINLTRQDLIELVNVCVALHFIMPRPAIGGGGH